MDDAGGDMRQEPRTAPLLAVEDLSILYDDVSVVEGFSLEIAPGEVVGLVGESGSGKTSIGLGLMGLCPGRVTGRVTFKDQDLMTLNPDRFRALRGDRIAMVFQDVAGLHPTYTVLDQVAEALRAHREISGGQARAQALTWLGAVGLPEAKASAFPHQLSGGERQRAMIAMATVNRPDLLILDEPVAFQDEEAKTELIHWFRSTFPSSGILLITHDVSVALRLATRLLILCGGRVVEEGPTEAIIRDPVHPYTRALLRSNVALNPHRELIRIPGDPTKINRRGCPFQPRCVQAVPACAHARPFLRPIRDRRVACHRGGVVALIAARSVSKTFSLKGRRIRALEEITLAIRSGEGVALMGPTGAGKSTLGAILARLLEPDTGEVVSDFDDGSFRRRVQMIHQHPKEAISPRFTVWETVEEPLRIVKASPPFEERIEGALREVGLPTTKDFLSRIAHTLSGGELKRLVLARALVLDPLVIVADEPTAGIDASFASQILRLLMTLQETRGISLLVITHDPYVAQKVADRILYLKDGRIEKITPSLTPVTHRHPAPLVS